VFENRQQQPRQVASYFISMGRGGPEKEKQGDLRTPLGVYFVQSYIPPQKLADKYGAGAYPINYPNAWDQFNGRTGHGIWLHGTRSGTYNRPPLASEGCVVLPNSDLLQVGAYITLGQTPVLIGNDMQWLSVEAWQQQQQQVSAIFEQWLRDWESLDTRKYLGHYSTAFSNGSKSYYEWVRHKQRVARHKSFIDVEASDVSLLMHPNEDVLVATFLQYYSSDNYMSQSWKRQYWRKESDGVWRIIFEGQIAEPAAPQLARTSDTLLDTAN
jgi:murein L,D-transpeptidase YafK